MKRVPLHKAKNGLVIDAENVGELDEKYVGAPAVKLQADDAMSALADVPVSHPRGEGFDTEVVCSPFCTKIPANSIFHDDSPRLRATICHLLAKIVRSFVALLKQIVDNDHVFSKLT